MTLESKMPLFKSQLSWDLTFLNLSFLVCKLETPTYAMVVRINEVTSTKHLATVDMLQPSVCSSRQELEIYKCSSLSESTALAGI